MFDVAIVGGGIAGASLGAALAQNARVVLLEAEDVTGYHSTGRSAAFWHETLGGPLVQTLSVASLDHLHAGGFLSPRTSLNVADAQHVPLLDALEAKFAGAGAHLRRLDGAGVREFVPRARALLIAGVLEERCADIDVAALHADYQKRFRAAGGEVRTGFRVEQAQRANGWTVKGCGSEIQARILVNAAGAWADELARMAGAAPLGLQPMRRTIAQVRVTTDDVPASLPLTTDISGTLYFKPEGQDRLWLCPYDETPVEAHDVAPEEIDVALAIDRFESITDWRVAAVERKWAGLRTFAPDRLPVFGFDPQIPDFFWCVGQGGVGIQTSPAAGELCAALLLRRESAIDPGPFSPARFR